MSRYTHFRSVQRSDVTCVVSLPILRKTILEDGRLFEAVELHFFVEMSFDWTSQPLSIQAIASQYTLPVAIRSAPGFRGSTRPIILHSISRVTFAFGRALKTSPTSTKNEDGTYRSIDSEIIAIPLKYPGKQTRSFPSCSFLLHSLGYFECLPAKHFGRFIDMHSLRLFIFAYLDKESNITPEKSIRSIVERMEADQRPQAFYLMSPIRVYTLETNSDGILTRTWHEIDANQMILFDKLIHVQYTPTVNDQLTDDDFALSWWICFGKQILPRNEYVLKCILTQQQIAYIPCSSTDEVNLIPVGQRGSSNTKKLQMINNLIEQFPLPINIKLTQLPGLFHH